MVSAPIESNKCLCRGCSLLKDRILAGKFDAINKKWVDESGLSWNGKTCPSCHQMNCRENMRKKRSNGAAS